MRLRRGNIANLAREQWSEVDDGMLTYMWVELGKSMGEIGRVLKRTRNSVAGRITRLKINRKTLAEKKSRA